MTKTLKPLIDVNGVHTHRYVTTEPVVVTRSITSSPPVVVTDKWSSERDAALELLEDLGEDIVVSNHGAFPNRRPTVDLNDMADGDIARGNCWSIVNELIEIAGTDYFGDYVDELNINTKGGLSHTGLFVKDGDKEYVIDYTARQFNQGLNFPLIDTVDNWKKTIETAYGQPFEYTPANSDDDDYDEYDDED